jgi:hypothetical protein
MTAYDSYSFITLLQLRMVVNGRGLLGFRTEESLAQLSGNPYLHSVFSGRRAAFR